MDSIKEAFQKVKRDVEFLKEEINRTAYATGCCLLFKASLIDDIGFMPEEYFLYYEDADFCRRIQEIGKRVYYYPKVFINHLVGATKSTQDKYHLNLESAKIYHGFFKFLVLQLIFRLARLKVI